MSRDEKNRDKIIRLNVLYKAMTGEEFYLYTSKPGDGQIRRVFVDGVQLDHRDSGAALAHMEAKYKEARAEWRSGNGANHDSARENTDWISAWLVNDYGPYSAAKELVESGACSVEAFATLVTEMLKDAVASSAAWHTARELSDADYDRVDWPEIMDTLTAE